MIRHKTYVSKCVWHHILLQLKPMIFFIFTLWLASCIVIVSRSYQYVALSQNTNKLAGQKYISNLTNIYWRHWGKPYATENTRGQNSEEWKDTIGMLASHRHVRRALGLRLVELKKIAEKRGQLSDMRWISHVTNFSLNISLTYPNDHNAGILAMAVQWAMFLKTALLTEFFS